MRFAAFLWLAVAILIIATAFIAHRRNMVCVHTHLQPIIAGKAIVLVPFCDRYEKRP